MSLPAADVEAQIPQLRRYARALTGDAWAADDLVQDTLERACDRWHLWRAGSDLRAWLFTLMHNLFIDGARRATRQATNWSRLRAGPTTCWTCSAACCGCRRSSAKCCCSLRCRT